MRDPYVYENSNVIKNKFNIKDGTLLEQVEKEYTSIRIREILKSGTTGKYNYEHLKDTHNYIFQDVYSWAGKERTINISKSEEVLNGMMFDYSKYENIKDEINSNLDKLNSIDWKKLSLDDRVEKYSEILANVWNAHAFREGNTRTTIVFFSQFAKEKGFKLNEKLLFDNIKYFRNSLVAASFKDKELGVSRNYSYLNRILKDSMKSNVKQNER